MYLNEGVTAQDHPGDHRKSNKRLWPNNPTPMQDHLLKMGSKDLYPQKVSIKTYIIRTEYNQNLQNNHSYKLCVGHLNPLLT